MSWLELSQCGNLYFVFIQKENVLFKNFTKEEGCYQDFKLPWQICESGLFCGFPGIALSQNPCRALGPVKLWVMCSSRYPLRILWMQEDSVTQALPVGDRTREYFHSYRYLATTPILHALSLHAL